MPNDTQSDRHDALRPDLIVKTIELLHARIGERFPESGLREVCKKVHVISQNMVKRADWISRPVIWLRVLVYCVIAMTVLLAIIPFWFAWQQPAGDLFGNTSFKDTLELVESFINDLLLIGAAIFFLLTVEPRYKRQRALDALRELRSLAHVIDMHQLTKDPHRIICEDSYDRRKLSPKVTMTQFELHRYLDYCSEMLALIGKIAAVYVQEFDDGVSMATASELEALTSGLSQKIWQKIAILISAEGQYSEEKSGLRSKSASKDIKLDFEPVGADRDANSDQETKSPPDEPS